MLCSTHESDELLRVSFVMCVPLDRGRGVLGISPTEVLFSSAGVLGVPHLLGGSLQGRREPAAWPRPDAHRALHRQGASGARRGGHRAADAARRAGEGHQHAAAARQEHHSRYVLH